jgi:predicted dehydrogenase
MDMGIYSLNACRYLTGEEPVNVKAFSSVIDRDGRFNEVEENLSWTMRFPSGAVATCTTSYGANLPGFYRVHGSKGMMHVEPAFGYEGLHLTANIQGEPPINEPNAAKDPSQFIPEADDLAQSILHNKEPKANGEEGLRDMKYIAAIYKSCGRP